MNIISNLMWQHFTAQYSVWRGNNATFPAEFCDEYNTIYSYTKNNHIKQKNKKQNKTKQTNKQTNTRKIIVSQWLPNYRFSFCIISIPPEGFFKWNLAHKGEHKSINIA